VVQHVDTVFTIRKHVIMRVPGLIFSREDVNRVKLQDSSTRSANVT